MSTTGVKLTFLGTNKDGGFLGRCWRTTGGGMGFDRSAGGGGGTSSGGSAATSSFAFLGGDGICIDSASRLLIPPGPDGTFGPSWLLDATSC